MIIKRAIKDTFKGQFTALYFLVCGGLFGLVYLYFREGQKLALDEVIFYEAAIAGAVASLALFFIFNLCAAPFRIERDAHEATKKKLSETPQGPLLPEIIYDTKWAKGIPTMPIHDVACALAGIRRESYAASARAQALAIDLVEATYDGWVCSQEAHMHLINNIGNFEVRVEGKPQFPGIEEATIETRIYTPSLREDYLLKRPDLNADWIPEQAEGNPMIVTMGV